MNAGLVIFSRTSGSSRFLAARIGSGRRWLGLQVLVVVGFRGLDATRPVRNAAGAWAKVALRPSRGT